MCCVGLDSDGFGSAAVLTGVTNSNERENVLENATTGLQRAKPLLHLSDWISKVSETTGSNEENGATDVVVVVAFAPLLPMAGIDLFCHGKK